MREVVLGVKAIESGVLVEERGFAAQAVVDVDVIEVDKPVPTCRKLAVGIGIELDE